MRLYFTISECCITDDPVPQDVADKLLRYHIVPMSRVREAYGAPIYASAKSVYRPVSYEKSKGRSGRSQHCFRGKGAGDWSAQDMKKLLEMIAIGTDYTRIAYYPGRRFFHCDYAAKERQYFISVGGKWQHVGDELTDLSGHVS